MKTCFTITALSVVFAASPVFADTVSLVRVSTDDYYSYMNLISDSSLDIASVKPVEYVDLVIPQSLLDEIAQDGYTYEYLMYDIYDPSHYAGKGYLSYHNYDEMLDSLNDLAIDYPDIFKLTDLGTGRVGSHHLWMAKVSDDVGNDDPEEHDLMVLGVHHAREPMSLEVPLYFLEQLCADYGSDPDVTYIVDNLELYVIPNVNPEGHDHDDVEYTRLWWRKNGYDTDGDGTPFEEYYYGSPYGEGVDLNRNYTYMWGYDDEGSSPIWWNSGYRGPSAGSEPEVAAVMDVCESHFIVSGISFHSYSELILRPWSYINDDPDNPVHMDIFDDIGYGYQEIIENEMGRTYDYRRGYNLYPVNGNTTDYWYGERGTFGFCVELNSEADGGFYPDESYIAPTTHGHYEALKWWCTYVAEGNIGIEEGNPATPNTFVLHNVSPNPARERAVFSFSLPSTMEITLDLYDIKGRKVMELLDDTMDGGENEVSANTGSLSAGVYLYKLTAGDYAAVKKLVIER